MRNNSIQLKRTPQRVELIKRMASANRQEALEAQESFAEFIRPAVEVVLNQKVTSNAIYRTLEFSKNDRPTIPLDLFIGTKENHVRTWSQQIAGGLPTNLIQGLNEYTFQVFRLDSAVSVYNDAIRNANVNILSAAIDRMINELTVKIERNAWSPLLAGIAANEFDQVVEAQVAGVFQLEDLNQLFVKMDRLYTSYVGGTPDGATPQGLTDLFVSPEVLADIRAFAYNPMNTRGGYKSDGSEQAGSIPLPDNVREQIFKAGGLLSIYDVNIHKLIELGVGAKYNAVFDNFYGGTFNPATQEVAIGFDLSQDVFFKAVVTDDDRGGGQVVVRPDDQFFARSEKTGLYSFVETSFLGVDLRATSAIII